MKLGETAGDDDEAEPKNKKQQPVGGRGGAKRKTPASAIDESTSGNVTVATKTKKDAGLAAKNQPVSRAHY